MTWAGGSEWIELSINVEMVLVSVVGAVVRGGVGVGKASKSNSDRLFDEGASLNTPIKAKESSLLAMVSLKNLGKRNGLPLRVPLRGNG